MGATEILYRQFKERPSTKLFLDTNAVLDLTEHELASAGRGGVKHEKLSQLLTAAAQHKSRLVTSPLVLEEIVHQHSRLVMKDACDRRGRRDEEELRRDFPDEHSKARKLVRAYLQTCIASLGKRSVVVEAPLGGDDPRAWGKRMLAAYQAILDGCDQVGPMDAMHVVWGVSLGCDAFVSKDSDMRFVPGITVYIP